MTTNMEREDSDKSAIEPVEKYLPSDRNNTKNAPQSRKRKADAIGRIRHALDSGEIKTKYISKDEADDSNGTTVTGRGSTAGWTYCPLCGRHSQKKYAVGRGIATHLHAVHTPWNPGKIERKIRRKEKKRYEAELNRQNASSQAIASCEKDMLSDQLFTWTPTAAERHAWDEKVLQILKDTEAISSIDGNAAVGKDRHGKAAVEYRSSLPPFLEAAASGDLETIKRMVDEAEKISVDSLIVLLDTRDRHLSLAEHWAAGGGHLECLQYILARRKSLEKETLFEQRGPLKKKRRRDGRSCLHFAARNGRLGCLKHLIEVEKMPADEGSGDGTTPLHLALYGCQLQAVSYLIKQGASLKKKNDWACGAAHWIALSKSGSVSDLYSICNLLREHGVSFTEVQSQGHSPLHKAAQKLNRTFLGWIFDAGLPEKDLVEACKADQGGHTPVDIWLAVGGDVAFADTMKEKLGRLS